MNADSITRNELFKLIEDYCAENGISWRKLAISSGVPYQALADFKRGGDGKRPSLPSYRNRMLLLNYLSGGSNSGGEVTVTKTVPVVGYVGAGAEVFPIDDHAKGNGMAEVECPSMLNAAKAIALEVRGDSMEPLISDGFLLFYEERAYGVPAEFIGSICVVKIADGATLVKKVRNGTKVGHYHLMSLNPHTATIENAQVEWSAKVKVMVQK